MDSKQISYSIQQKCRSLVELLRFFVFAFFVLNSIILTAQNSSNFSIITDEDHPDCGCVQLENPPLSEKNVLVPEDLQVFLFPRHPESTSLPIIGTWEQQGNNFLFCPLISFTKNLTYQARFPGMPSFTFKAEPKRNYTLSNLLKVFPNATAFPENTLKMYLYFSAPMSEGAAYPYIQLKDQFGKVVEQAFLELYPLLWNAERTRLTLWFDPGRIKRDLGPNQRMGSPLKAGNFYTLHISKNWKDANGYSLEKDFEQSFEVTSADRIVPKPSEWVLSTPKVATKQPLLIDFKEALDHALAMKSLSILNEKGEEIKGGINLQKQDQQWLFTPKSRWKSGIYKIKIASRLEDLAGNNLNRLFDRDLKKEPANRPEKVYYYLKFVIENP